MPALASNLIEERLPKMSDHARIDSILSEEFLRLANDQSAAQFG
jgi:hypothetical protein